MAVDAQAVRSRRPAGTATVVRQAHPRRFAPPEARAGSVPRRALVRRLREAAAVPVVVLCAPAGYGKTTLLAQWADAVPGRVAWISLGPAHADRRELVADLLGALAVLGPARGAAALAAAGPPASPLGRIRHALDQVSSPGALVIDDAHLLRDGEGLDAVRMICAGLPAGSQVALACRVEPALRLGLLRSRGLLLRLGPADLAMARAEAAGLLSGAGIDLEGDEVDALVERTEGWPVGLYLTGLGDERSMDDYVVDEVLDGLDAAHLDLLARTSVLDRLSAPACDAVLGRPGSGPLLAEIERTGAIRRASSPRDSYRHHPLVRRAVRARLARRTPELIPALHGAASAWFETTDDAELAIEHAGAAGDARRTGELVCGSLPGRLTTGRLDEVRRWLDPHTPAEIGASPALAAAAAWCGMERGGEAAEHWVEVAGRDGAEAGVLRAAAARTGVVRMREDAAAARGRWPQHSPWHALSCALEGVALDLAGDRDGALERLHQGARRAGPELPWVDLLCCAWLCLIAQREGAWGRAERLGQRADAAMAHEGLDGYATAALAHSAWAVLLARAGRGDDARRRRARARTLLASAPLVAPWRDVASRALMARASVLLGDPLTARVLLDEAREPFAHMSDSPVIRDELASVRESVEGLEPGARRPHVPLTAAETRVVRFLPTHHSFREIGEHLHLSRFTVKSQALAIYRKLDVTSRGDAVARARALGLIDGPG